MSSDPPPPPSWPPPETPGPPVPPPPPAPPGYGAYPGYPPAPPGMPGGTSTNGFAIASLVLGIVGGFACFGWILALVFGYIAKSQIEASGGRQQGRGMAIAGIVLGWAWLALFVLYFVVIIIVSIADSN